MTQSGTFAADAPLSTDAAFPADPALPTDAARPADPALPADAPLPTGASIPAAPVIRVRGLRKSYGDVAAVRGIDLDVAQGEVFALLGPNGAGKTTTLEILEGYRSRTGGEVSVLGSDPSRRDPALLARTGICLQETGIERYLTVAEVLGLYAGYYPRPRPVTELIETVGLTDAAGTLVRRLSGGQRRRLDLALALAGDPELLFLDEPTTGFDPEARRGAWDLVRSFRGAGRTVILTTHQMDEAEALADRIGVMVDGRIVALGSAADIVGERATGTRLRWRVSADAAIPVPEPPTLAGAQVHHEPDGGRSLTTEDATAALHELTGWAMACGVPLGDLRVGRATLEDAYLDLVAAHGGDARPTPPATTPDTGRRRRRGRP